MVFLPELTLGRYPAFVRGGDDPGERGYRDLRDGPTGSGSRPRPPGNTWCARARFALLKRDGTSLHCYGDGLGFNTAVPAGPDGLITYTRKLYIL